MIINTLWFESLRVWHVYSGKGIWVEFCLQTGHIRLDDRCCGQTNLINHGICHHNQEHYKPGHYQEHGGRGHWKYCYPSGRGVRITSHFWYTREGYQEEGVVFPDEIYTCIFKDYYCCLRFPQTIDSKFCGSRKVHLKKLLIFYSQHVGMYVQWNPLIMVTHFSELLWPLLRGGHSWGVLLN